MLILEPLALAHPSFAIQIDPAEPAIASGIWLDLNTGNCHAIGEPLASPGTTVAALALHQLDQELARIRARSVPGPLHRARGRTVCLR
jgi:hypothetical protein